MKHTTIDNILTNKSKHLKLSRQIPYAPTEIHNRNRQNAIVMFSGGMDSTVSLWWALYTYSNVKVLIIDYNQPHKMEIEYAKRISDMLRIDYRIINVNLPENFWGLENYLTRGQACFMTSLAALDIGHEGADIVLGILKTDIYGDCDRHFLDSLAEVLYHNNDWGNIGIATPLRAVKDKCDVAALGYRFGAPITLSWSCRRPINGLPCGKCVQCKERESAIQHLENRYSISWNTIKNWQAIMGSPYHPAFHKISRDLFVLTQAFLQTKQLKNEVSGWKYTGPDGIERIASKIRNPHSIINSNQKLPGIMCQYVHASGIFDDGTIWEVCICNNGSVAVTDNLPDIHVIEQELIKNVKY